MVLIWIKFATCALAIFYAGSQLSRYADIIAEKTGLGRAWIGLVLLASITSLPELANNLGAITYVNAPDLALGDLFGSCLFNIFILAILDLLYGPGPILGKADMGHILSATLGIVLIGVSAMGIMINHRFVNSPFFHVGYYTIAIAIIYLISQQMIFQYEKRKQVEYLKDKFLQYKEHSFKTALYRFAFFALIVVAAGSYLPKIGQEVSEATALGNTFVGSIFLAIATSLPEIAVSAFALKLGAIDMAVGNLFGSNVFNMFIIFIDDIFYIRGPILANVSQNHIFTAILAIVMTAIAMAGLIFRSDKKVFGKFSWDAIAIIAVYLFSVYSLFLLGIPGN